MNRTIRAATPAHRGVRGIDYGIDFLLRDVAKNRGDFQHAAQYASGHRRQRSAPLRRRLTGPELLVAIAALSRSSITAGRGLLQLTTDWIALHLCYGGMQLPLTRGRSPPPTRRSLRLTNSSSPTSISIGLSATQNIVTRNRNLTSSRAFPS